MTEPPPNPGYRPRPRPRPLEKPTYRQAHEVRDRDDDLDWFAANPERRYRVRRGVAVRLAGWDLLANNTRLPIFLRTNVVKGQDQLTHSRTPLGYDEAAAAQLWWANAFPDQAFTQARIDAANRKRIKEAKKRAAFFNTCP